MNNDILVDIIGWIGAITVLIAYALVSTRKMEGDSIAYQLINVIGSLFLLINSLFYRAYPVFGVNVAWVGIGIYAIARKKPLVPRSRE